MAVGADDDAPARELGAVERGDGALGRGLVGKLDEAEASTRRRASFVRTVALG